MAAQTFSVGANPRIELKRVGADLSVTGADRFDLEASGDDLQQIKQEQGSLQLSCSGDLKLSVPRAASLSVVFAGGDVLIADLDGQVDTSFIGGDAKFENLSGQVTISGVMGDLKLVNVTKVSVEPGRPAVNFDLPDQIRRKVELTAQRAQRQADRAVRRADQKVRQAERHARRWNVNWSAGTNSATPAPEPVSDDERLSILKMLQDKKITAEEAEKLLAALEGGA